MITKRIKESEEFQIEIHQTLTRLATDLAVDVNEKMEDARTSLVREIITLSDKIESEHETTMEEWKAFKHFRNTLRDKYLKKP